MKSLTHSKFVNPATTNPVFHESMDKPDLNLPKEPSLRNRRRILERIKKSVMPEIRKYRSIRAAERQGKPVLAQNSQFSS
jgi:hypothetical protein